MLVLIIKLSISIHGPGTNGAGRVGVKRWMAGGEGSKRSEGDKGGGEGEKEE